MNMSPILAQFAEWMGAVAVAMLAGISPRFKHRPIQFVYPRREINLSLSIYAAIVALAFIIYSIFPPAAGQLPLPHLILAALSAVPFALALRLRGQPIRSAGWNPQYLRAALMLGIALALLAMFLRGQIMNILSLSSDKGILLLVWLGISAGEESIFRGYILIRFVSVWGQWAGISATSLLYALWHLPLMLVLGQDFNAILAGLGLALVQGFVLGYIANKAGHVLPVILYRAFSQWLLAL
jgi:membrane protease YdiL (CAAX protease family)